jgi:hypothetical protein
MLARFRGAARQGGGAAGLAVLLALLLATDALALSWKTTTAMTAGGTGWANPGGLAVSSSTTAHAILERYVVDSWEVLYRRTTNSGASWAAPVRLSRPEANEAGSPVIDAYGSGVNAAWLEGDDVVAGIDTIVVTRRSTDAGATWSDQVQLSPTQESAGPPRIARYGSRVAVVWTDQLTGRIYMRRSSNGGATWASRQLVATTTNRPYTGARSALREGFPVAAYGSSGAFYVAYYSASKVLKIRRSTNYGASLKSAKTLAKNAVTKSWAPPALAARSSAVIVGYATTTAGKWTVIRRSTDKGVSWRTVVSLHTSKKYWSGPPVLAVRGKRWMVAYERCNSTCSTSVVYYRASTTNGSKWTIAQAASTRKTKYNVPADVDVATKTMLLYVDYSSTTNDVYLRRGW